MASNDNRPHFKAAAVAVTAFSSPQEEAPTSTKQKRRRRRSRDKSQSFELYKNLSAELGTPHNLAGVGNLEELKYFIESLGATLKETNKDGETLLHSATRTNQLTVMQYLIDSGIDLNAINNDGNTALHVAVENGHVEALHLLLNSGASDTILNKKMDAPLHIIARSNNTDLFAAILEHPIELVIPGYRKRTPLHILAELDNLEACEVLHNSILVKEVFKQQGGFRLCATDEDNLTPIHLSARAGSSRVLDFMMKKCVEHHYPIETVMAFLDEENSTPLHAAVDGGHENVVEVLLKNGADPTVIRYEQMPPLHLACSQGKLQMVKMMVEAKGKEILQSRDQYGQSPIHRCAHAINSAQMIAYILQFKVEIDAVDNLGRTPLHIAVISGSLPAVKELLENGANPLQKDEQGRNTLQYAVFRNRRAIVMFLLELPCAGELVMAVDKNCNCAIHAALTLGHSSVVASLISVVRFQLVNCKDANGNNYLHLAASSGDWKALSILLDIPACQQLLNETNKGGATPLHMAAGNGHLRCVEMLLNQGAMVHKCHTGLTPFMYALYTGHADCASACFNAHPFQKEWTDDKGNNGLHLAAHSGNPSCVCVALDKGIPVALNFNQQSFFDEILDKANRKMAMAVVKHDRWQECLDLGSPKYPSPMIGLVIQMPDVAKAVYDRCYTTSTLDSGNPCYWKKYDFKYLRLKTNTPGETEVEEMDSKEDDPLVPKDMLSPVIKYKRSWNLPRPTIEKMTNCQRRRNIPPLKILRAMVQYRRVQLLTHPVVEAYIKSKWRDYGRWIYIVGFAFFALQVAFLTAFILTAPRAEKVLELKGENNTTPDFSVGVNTLRFITLFLCVLSFIQWILTLLSLGRKAFDFVQNIWVWIFGFALICTFIGLIPFRGLNSALWEATALGVFFSWFMLMLMLQLFDLVGVYVTMFLSITRTVFQVLLLCFILVIAFSLTFFILAGNVVNFSTFGYSLFINFGHLLGEIDYSAFVRKSSEDELAYDSLTLTLVIVLAILMAIVIMNLLIGLAVGDIDKIRRNAVIEKRSLEVGIFSRLDADLPKRLLARFDRHYYKSYPNSKVSALRNFWRFFWRSIKGDIDLVDNSQLQTSHTVTGQEKRFQALKQQLEDLTVSQEKLIAIIREMHAAQQQMLKERTVKLSEFQD